MASLRAINRKAKQVSQLHAAEKGDLVGLQDPSSAAGKVYHPMGCTLNFTPGWEIDISGGTDRNAAIITIIFAVQFKAILAI